MEVAIASRNHAKPPPMAIDPGVRLALAPVGHLLTVALRRVARLDAAPFGLEIELFAFGRAPLAMSSRCHHARAAGLRRDGYRYVCDRDPDGAGMTTLEGQAFLAINGLQTLSHGVHVAAADREALARAGLTALRLSPHGLDMVRVAEAFRRLADGRIDGAGLIAEISTLAPPGALVSGYLDGVAGSRAAAPAP